MPKNFTIIGGGIAGLTTAIALNKIGIEATVFEAAPALHPIGAGLALAGNAMQAYQHLALADAVKNAGYVLPTFAILDQKGKVITEADTAGVNRKYNTFSVAIHRAALHEVLLSQIKPDRLILNKRATGFERKDNALVVQFQDGTTHPTDYLIVADGIHSQIRQQLLPGAQTRYAGYTCWRAVIDNTDLSMEGSTESWGPGRRFGIVPLADNKIYWFACTNASPQDTRRVAAQRIAAQMKNFTVNDLYRHFQDFHDPIPSILLQTKDEELIWNDIIDLNPIDSYAFDNIVLVGDAAHATTPNMGQGACQAIEDAVILAGEIKKNRDIPAAFKSFEKRRMKRTHFIVNNSWSLGKIAQLENKFLCTLRNFAFRTLPASLNEHQVKKLYEVDF